MTFTDFDLLRESKKRVDPCFDTIRVFDTIHALIQSML